MNQKTSNTNTAAPEEPISTGQHTPHDADRRPDSSIVQIDDSEVPRSVLERLNRDHVISSDEPS
jgi:hypothetical protein